MILTPPVNIARRRSRAQSLVEVTIGIAIIIPVMLFLFDLSLIFLAVQSNETVCRNAARAAATGDPLDAQLRAKGVVDQANANSRSPFVSGYDLAAPVEVKITDRPARQEDPLTSSLVSAGGSISGTAKATTAVGVMTLVIYRFWGGKAEMKFSSSRTFPISYIEPAR